MNNYITSYGFVNINEGTNNIKNEINWMGNYDGNKANVDVNIINNGHSEFVSMQLNNNDIMKLLGIQSIQLPLEHRLLNDFSNTISLKETSTNKSSLTNSRRKHTTHKH